MAQRSLQKYGWRRQNPDVRDFKFQLQQEVVLPSKVDLRQYDTDPIYDQSQEGACSGNAYAGAIRYKLAQQGIKFGPSRQYIYFNARRLEGTTSSDSGATNRDCVSGMTKWGVASEDIWGYDISQYATKPSDAAYTAGNNLLLNKYEWVDNRSLYLLKQMLAQKIQIVFGFSVYSSFEDNIGTDGVMPMPDFTKESLLGGHDTRLLGYDDSVKKVIVRNSYGPNWGDHGDFYMPYDYITNPNLASDFSVLDSFTITNTISKPKISAILNPVDVARQFLFVREVPQNRGLRVEAIQHWSSGQFGDSWCAEFATMILDICYQGNAPIPRLQACEGIYNLAKKNNWLTSTPVMGDLYLYVDANDHAHHVGIYTGGGNGIAGNTSADGTSSNGDRVAEHSLITNPSLIKYVHYL